MKFREVANRLDGFSTPIFGMSWTPAVLDRDVAHKVVTFIEARRVLFSSHTNEVPRECVESVLAIRDFLTEVLGAGGIASELTGPLRLIRRYCIRFLERVGATETQDPAAAGRRLFRDAHWGMHDYWFGEALGELRAGVGLQVAVIAAAFGLDVDDALGSQLPPAS